MLEMRFEINNKNSFVISPIGISLPCIFEIFIFQCFRFADWRKDLNSEIQLRIMWGSLAIALFFVSYYAFMFVWVKKNYMEENKTRQLFKICLFAILGILSFTIGYFL